MTDVANLDVARRLGDGTRKRPLFPFGATFEQIESEPRNGDATDLMTRRHLFTALSALVTAL